MKSNEKRHEERAAGLDALDITEVGAWEWAAARRCIADTALAEWRLGVAEPGSSPIANPKRIDEYIRGPLGLAWSWLKPYTKDEQFAWCGAFAAFCAGTAGVGHALRFKRMASTLRINNHLRNTRGVELDAIEPGDILVVTNGSKSYGEHICVAVEKPANGLVVTVEGNARGILGNGRVGNGVIRRTRPLAPMPKHRRCPMSSLKQSHWVLYAIRFKPEDFDRGVEP